MTFRSRIFCLVLFSACSSLIVPNIAEAQAYIIAGTGQRRCYGNSVEIPPPHPGDPFYGQDAQQQSNQPTYRDNGDGTISDLVTGLMWIKSRGRRSAWNTAMSDAGLCTVGGYSDWRVPTIKELYSLINFNGKSAQTARNSIPYIDTSYFEFVYGDVAAGERLIDCQDWSATEYVSTTMNGDPTVFGVNFADGRIKGYPKRRPGSGGGDNMLYARYVRGDPAYGRNDFVDNGDSTISDRATGLMWSLADSRVGLNWEAALSWVETRNSGLYLGHDDWRIPSAKELQSIVDYTRAPDRTDSPAIDPLFEATPITNEAGVKDYPYFWTGTTHLEGPPPGASVYVCFGRSPGYMEMPPGSGSFSYLDVHGAGAQRSDPKTGDPANYPHGLGPQGDVIRVQNFVRLVRGGALATDVRRERGEYGAQPGSPVLLASRPNPFSSDAVITVTLASQAWAELIIFDAFGRAMTTLADGPLSVGEHAFPLAGASLPDGVYFCLLKTGGRICSLKMILCR